MNCMRNPARRQRQLQKRAGTMVRVSSLLLPCCRKATFDGALWPGFYITINLNEKVDSLLLQEFFVSDYDLLGKLRNITFIIEPNL